MTDDWEIDSVKRTDGDEKKRFRTPNSALRRAANQRLEPAATVKIWEPSGLIELATVYDQEKFQTEEWDRESNELKKYNTFLDRDIIQLIEDRIEAIETHLEEYDAEEAPEEDWVIGRKAQIRELENLKSSLEVEE